MDNRPIGMFDSGVGGMTVLKEIIKELPNEDIIYIGDTANFPYGSKTKGKILQLTKKKIEKLIEKDVKLIVIACGTATSQALEEARKIYNIPIIGIIEPTVKYMKKKKFKNIGIVATTGTIRSKGWEKIIEKEMEGVEIQSKACPLLAPIAEEGWTENEIAKLAVKEYMQDMNRLDALVLGCTHYPLFKKFFENEVDINTEVINTGEIISKEVKEYIEKNNLMNTKKNNPEYQVYLTDMECNFINVAKKLLGNNHLIEHISKL